jgi:hypothetical protein
MSVSSTTILGIEGTSPDPGYLCDAMFIAGARALGLGLNEEISPEAQEKIIEAAAVLVERLREILKMTTSPEEERELGN